MTNKDTYLYPVTQATLHKYADDVFMPIRRGECVTTVWVPMTGRRMLNKFLIENIHLFEKELPHFDKYLLTYIEPLDLTEETLAGYIRLMAKSFIEVAEKNKYVDKGILGKYLKIFDDEGATYSFLLQNLKLMLKETTDSGLEIVFFVGEFDELGFANTIFYNNLKSLWSQLYPRLHYVFLMREYVIRDDNLEKWGDFNEAILQNIVYVPLLNDKDFEYVVERLATQYGAKLNKARVGVLKKLCGGHPYLIKVSLRILQGFNGEKIEDDTFEKALIDHYEVKSVSRGILDVQTERQKKILAKIAEGETVSELEGDEANALEKLGIVKLNEKGQYDIFGELIVNAIESVAGKENEFGHKSSKLEFENATGTILLGGKGVEEKFTPQEYSILTMLLGNTDKVSNRDDIGKILWGKESYEKYSDWAIDQLMSKLRKKLLKLQIKDKLVTIRGKGYKIVRGNG